MDNHLSQTDFELWVNELRPRLIRMAYSILKNYDEAEDVVQETLVMVWAFYSDGKIDNLTSYTKRAVWVNSLKSKSRGKNCNFVCIDDLAEHGIAEPYVDAEIDRTLTAWELEDAIMDLPVDQQVVIRMRFYGDLSFSEIGNALSISLNTAASRCRYALVAMRKAFSVNK